MANFTDAFQPEGGINLDDLLGIFAGGIDPSVVGEAAPLGSLFIRSTGHLYQKVGIADTDWMIFSQGLGEAVKISATDTTAGYLNAKLLVSSSLTKTVGTPSGNETLTLDLANIGTPGTYRSVTTNSKGQVTAGTNPTTLAGYGITDAQQLATNLTNIASQTGVGFYVRQNAGGTTTTRSIAGTTNQISVLGGDGASGNPTLSLSQTILFPGTTGIRPPSGTTAQRVATAPYLRFNTDTTRLEYFNGTTWVELVASTGGTVTAVAATAPAAGITISGSPITSSGTFTFALANDLAAAEGLATTGIVARTAADTWATRTLIGTADRVTLANGDAIAGNPTFDIASTYAGQTSIVTLGNVTTGTWSADTISTGKGGTGRTTIGSANQVLGVNTVGGALEYKTINNGAGIGIAFASNLITLSNTGVLSITGTANQVIASAGTGAITLSLPQSINTAATPTFAQITLAGNPTLPLQVATKQYVDNAIEGVDHKASVRLASTTAISLFGATVVDGIGANLGDRVLIKNQVAPAENGVYVVSAGAWTRAADMDDWLEVPSAYVFVEEGNTLADTSWVSTANSGGTLGTTAMPWVQFSSAGDILAGAGLTKSGNTLSITNTVAPGGPFNQITYNAQGLITAGSNVSYLTGNQTITLSGDTTGSGTTSITTTLSSTGVTAGTYKSVTVDAKGRVTAATNPTTLAGFGITDAQPLDADLTALANTTGTGLYTITGAGTSATRTLIAGSSKISLTDGSGVAGNPTIDVNETNLSLNNIGGTLSTSKGGTGITSIGLANQILSTNTAGTGLEYRVLVGGTGVTVTPGPGGFVIDATNNGTVTSVAATGSTGLTVGGSPITGSGTLTLTLGTELQGLSGLAALGIVTRTTAGTYASRSIVSGVGTIAITNPLGTAGNIGLDLTTVGTAGTYKSVTTDAYGRVTAGTNPTTLAGYGITDAIPLSQKGAANGVATLDAGGKLTIGQLPATAITDTSVVASQAAMLALTAEVGDVAVRTDLNKSFILRAAPATVLANWQELLTPTDAVLSVNGQTGIVSVGTVTSMNVIGATGIQVSGGPVTTAGSVTLSLTNDLSAVEGLVGTGFAVRTSTDVWETRTLVAGAGISITNADGTGGSPVISATGTTGVTSVGLSLPSIFTVSGSPVTSTGTLTAVLASQAPKTVLAAPTGIAGVPAFRQLSLNDNFDVNITSPLANQVLAYDSVTSKWLNTGAVGANAAGLIGVGQAGAAAWTLVSGTRYRADFAHNLGTTNVVITIFDTATNAVVIADSTVLTSANNVRVTVVGNTRTLRVVVVANGQSIVAGGSTPSSVIVSKDGVTVGTTTTKINFTGQAVGVTDAGANTTNVNIGARYSYFANSLDTPNNADFAINALAPVTTDPSFNSLNVRSFSNTIEQGVGFTCSIPPGATTMTFKFRGRATTAPGAASVVQPRLYARLLPNNSAVGAWSVASELANINIPTNAFFQYAQQTVSLATLGLTADRLYQFELTRRVTGVTGTNLGSAFLLAEMTIEFA